MKSLDFLRLPRLSLDLPDLERLTGLLRRLDGRHVAWRPSAVALRQRWTEAPKALTEAELVATGMAGVGWQMCWGKLWTSPYRLFMIVL